MSKLSKFKEGVDAEEAATLLSRLIGEDVTEKDIHELFYNGYINQYIKCSATLVEAKPMLDPEQHTAQVNQGRYIMESGEDVSMCWGVHIPCLTIQLDENHEVSAICDESGNLYALRDSITGQYLNFLGDAFSMDNALYEPSDIYQIAEKANNDFPAIAEFSIKQNKWCPEGEIYFNFVSEGDFPKNVQPQKQTIDAAPRTSQLLAIASILEIAMEKSERRFNQSSLIEEIMERADGRRGLSQSGLTKLFAAAKGAAEEWKKQ